MHLSDLDLAGNPTGWINLCDHWYPVVLPKKKIGKRQKTIRVFHLNEAGHVTAGTNCDVSEFFPAPPEGATVEYPMPGIFPAPLSQSQFDNRTVDIQEAEGRFTVSIGKTIIEQYDIHRLIRLLELAQSEIERKRRERSNDLQTP